MNTHREQKVVRVFISSTFSEFELERTLLVSTVFPRLREKFANRGISVIPVDLRWGLERSQIDKFGLIDACLNQVVDCYPYFIGLLGNRYGTTVTAEDLRNSQQLKSHTVKSLTDRPISITELEFQIGALQNQNEYAVLFDRSSKDLEENTKQLIETIKKQGHTLTHYESLESFEDLIYEKLVQLIDERFPEDVVVDPEEATQIATLYQHVDTYVAGSPVVNEALIRLRSHKGVYIQGSKGVGKSAALAYCVKKLSTIDTEVIFYFCNTGYCFDELGFLRKIATYFESLFNMDFGLGEDDYASIVGKLSAGLSNLETTKNVFLCIDAIEQISSRRNLWLTVDSICKANDKITCLMTGTEHLGEESELVLHGLSQKQVKTIVNNKLSYSGKTLRYNLRKKLINCHGATNPIMLHGILNELTIIGNFDSLPSQIADLTSIKSIQELFLYAIQRVINECINLDLPHNPIREVLFLLSNVHFGATEDEISNATDILPLVWISLKNALTPYLTSIDGRFRFNHQLIEQIARECLTNEEAEIVTKHVLSEYEKSPHSAFRIMEYAHWCFVAEEFERLASAVFNKHNFTTLIENDEDGLMRYLSLFSKNEFLIKKPLLHLLEQQTGEIDIITLCTYLSRCGCVSSCIMIADMMAQTSSLSADLLVLKARAIDKQGNYKIVDQAFEEAQIARIAEKRKETASYALLLLQYAIAEKSCGKGRFALELAKASAKIFRSLNQLSNDALWCYTYESTLEFCFGSGATQQSFEEILKLQMQLSGENSYAFCRIICYCWQAYLLAGNLEAADILTSHSKIGLFNTSGESPDYAWALTNRATVLACMEKYEEAIKHSQESARLNSQTAGGGMHTYSLTGSMNEILVNFLVESSSSSNIALTCANTMSKLKQLHIRALDFHKETHSYVINIAINIALIKLHDPATYKAYAVCNELHQLATTLSESLGGKNSDSLFLETCAWRYGGSGNITHLKSEYKSLGIVDCALEALIKGQTPPKLRLAVNNGAALYLVPYN